MPLSKKKMDHPVVLSEEEDHRRRWLLYALQTPQPNPTHYIRKKTSDKETPGETC